jgi:replicative DNA helicase
MQTFKKNNINGSGNISDKLLAKYEIIPPNNLKSEQDFLIGLIEHKDTIESFKMSGDVRSIFYNEIGTQIYDSIVELYEKGALTINVLIINLQAKGLLKKAKEIYTELLQDTIFIDYDIFIQTFKSLSDLANQRACLDTILGSIHDLENGNVDKIVEKTEFLIERLKSTNLEIVDYGIRNHMDATIEKITMMVNNPVGIFPTTGISALNPVIPYWYDSDMIIIAGRPGAGKTISGIKHTIEAANQGFPVGYISLEMPATSLITRMISAYSRIPYSRIKEGKIWDSEHDRFNSSVAAVKELPIYFYDSHYRDIKDISKWMRIMAKEKGVKMFVVDYIQLIRDKTKKDDEYSQITACSMQMKQLQTELKVPIIALAQLSREVEGTTHKRPSLKDLKGSGQLEQDGSVIIMLYRSDLNGFEEAKKTNTFYEFENTIEYIVHKNREGGTASILLHCEPAYNIISDL